MFLTQASVHRSVKPKQKPMLPVFSHIGSETSTPLGTDRKTRANPKIFQGSRSNAGFLVEFPLRSGNGGFAPLERPGHGLPEPWWLPTFQEKHFARASGDDHQD